MDLSEAYEQGCLDDHIEPARASAPSFADLAEVGRWLERQLVARLRRAGLHGEVEADALLATEEEPDIPDGGGKSLTLRGVLALRQDCRAEDTDGGTHAGLVVPFSVSGRLREKDGMLVLEAACLSTEDADVAYLD